MHLSDAELLCAAQTDATNRDDAREEIPIRFNALLLYLAGWACRRCGLHRSEVEEVVQSTLLALFTTASPFDPSRGAVVEPYFRGLVQNAARSHQRFLRKGADRRHDYADSLNVRLALPSSPDEVADRRDDLAVAVAQEHNAKAADAVLVMANPEMAIILRGLYYLGKTQDEMAVAIGTDRSTVSRRLARFRDHVSAQGGVPYYAA